MAGWVSLPGPAAIGHASTQVAVYVHSQACGHMGEILRESFSKSYGVHSA